MKYLLKGQEARIQLSKIAISLLDDFSFIAVGLMVGYYIKVMFI